MHYNLTHYISGEGSAPVFRLAGDGEQSSTQNVAVYLILIHNKK
jgi:hypothetical protein